MSPLLSFACAVLPPGAGGALCLLCAAIGLFVGVAVGATGIGGVLLVPALSMLLRVDIKTAVAACMCAYIATGLVQTTLCALRGSLPGRDAAVICVATMPAAAVAGFALPRAPSPLLTFATATLAIVSGVAALANALRRTRWWRRLLTETGRNHHVGASLLSHSPEVGTKVVRDRQTPTPARNRINVATGGATSTAHCDELPLSAQILLGVIVGFGSAVTGTGGPFLMLPLLLLLRPNMPILRVVGLGQAVPMPIAVAATFANAYFSEVDMCVAAAVAITVIPGLPVGVYLAHRIESDKNEGSTTTSILRALIACLLVGIGGTSLGRLALQYSPLGWMWGRHFDSHRESTSSSASGNMI
eukprot:SAG31_NODE_7698_length_1614_cov_1.089109_1_plen_359_part_00